MDDDYVLDYEDGPGPVEVAVPVAAYLRTLNGALEELGGIVQGEVTEVRAYPFGMYFSLKDSTGADGVLGCFIAALRIRAFGHLIVAGTEIRVGGVPRVAPRKGSFSFQVEAVQAVGEGALRAAYEQLKKELREEGLFDRALPVPLCARRIGVVTSRQGAVIDDFRRNLDRRGYRVLMHDARVEGVHAVASILEALAWFRQHADRIDVLVVMRGGGSLEDLQAFNNEEVARAIAAMPVPVIAAIGHDRDVPIANLAADLSTSTPSIAALEVNRSWTAADERLLRSAERLRGRSHVLVHRVRERIARDSLALRGALADIVEMPERHFAEARIRFAAALRRAQDQVAAWGRDLELVDPGRMLRLGYAVISGPDGKAARSVDALPPGSRMQARLSDGTIEATVTDARKED